MFLRTASSCLLVLIAALGAAAQPKSITVAASPDFDISGVLVDSNTGQPISRARVAVAPVTKRDNFTTVVTHEDGRFSFSNLTPGKYTLTAQARGYLLQSFNQHDQLASSIVVGPDLDSTNLMFRLSPEGSISGMVADEAGEPVRNAQVILYLTGLSAGTEATRLRGRTMTNDEGAYHFGHLLPGRYLVAVSARPWYAQNQSTGRATSSPTGGTTEIVPPDKLLDVAYPLTFFPGVIDAGAATPIAVGRGEKVAADINLQPVPAVHLRLGRDKSDPERPTRISFEKRVLDGPPVQITMAVSGNQQNEQEISGLPPGHYTLRTFFAGQGGPGEAAPSREIDVGSNGEIDNSRAGEYVPVAAKLQFAAGFPSGQVYLQFLNKKSREVFSGRVGSDGEMTLRQGLAAGSYEISLSSDSRMYLKSISATGAGVTGRTIEVRPGGAVNLAIAVANGQGQITGTALRNGKPLAGAMIVLVPADPAHNQVLYRRDQSDSDGTFTLAAVVPGTYTLLAIENGWDLEWMKPAVLRPYMAAGAPVQVEVNGKYDVKIPVQ